MGGETAGGDLGGRSEIDGMLMLDFLINAKRRDINDKRAHESALAVLC